MYLLHGSQPPFLQTHLAQWVRGGVAVADAFPGSAVFLVAVGSPFVTVVVIPHGFPMFFAVGAV